MVFGPLAGWTTFPERPGPRTPTTSAYRAACPGRCRSAAGPGFCPIATMPTVAGSGLQAGGGDSEDGTPSQTRHEAGKPGWADPRA
jgi:hypothetical protein